MPSTPKIPVGPASKTGYLAALAGILTTVGVAITGSEAQLSGPGKWAAILGIVALVSTNVMRQLQAKELIKAEALLQVEGVPAVPSEAQELAQMPPDTAIPPAALESVPVPAAAPPPGA